MPPKETTSELPFSEEGDLYLICKDCQPELELYEVTARSSYMASFRKKSEEKQLLPKGKYRLILVNDADDPTTPWSYNFRIERRVGRQKEILLKVNENGYGQTVIRRNFFFKRIT